MILGRFTAAIRADGLRSVRAGMGGRADGRRYLCGRRTACPVVWAVGGYWSVIRNVSVGLSSALYLPCFHVETYNRLYNGQHILTPFCSP